MSGTRNSTNEGFVMVCVCLPALHSLRVHAVFVLTFVAFRSNPLRTQQTRFSESCAPCCCLYPVKILVKHCEVKPAVFPSVCNSPCGQQCLGQSGSTGLNLWSIIFCHIRFSTKLNDEIVLYIYGTGISSTLPTSRYDNYQDKFGSNLLKNLVFHCLQQKKTF